MYFVVYSSLHSQSTGLSISFFLRFPFVRVTSVLNWFRDFHVAHFLVLSDSNFSFALISNIAAVYNIKHQTSNVNGNKLLPLNMIVKLCTPSTYDNSCCICWQRFTRTSTHLFEKYVSTTLPNNYVIQVLKYKFKMFNCLL